MVSQEESAVRYSRYLEYKTRSQLPRDQALLNMSNFRASFLFLGKDVVIDRNQTL